MAGKDIRTPGGRLQGQLQPGDQHPHHHGHRGRRHSVGALLRSPVPVTPAPHRLGQPGAGAGLLPGRRAAGGGRGTPPASDGLHAGRLRPGGDDGTGPPPAPDADRTGMPGLPDGLRGGNAGIEAVPEVGDTALQRVHPLGRVPGVTAGRTHGTLSNYTPGCEGNFPQPSRFLSSGPNWRQVDHHPRRHPQEEEIPAAHVRPHRQRQPKQTQRRTQIDEGVAENGEQHEPRGATAPAGCRKEPGSPIQQATAPAGSASHQDVRRPIVYRPSVIRKQSPLLSEAPDPYVLQRQ